MVDVRDTGKSLLWCNWGGAADSLALPTYLSTDQADDDIETVFGPTIFQLATECRDKKLEANGGMWLHCDSWKSVYGLVILRVLRYQKFKWSGE